MNDVVEADVVTDIATREPEDDAMMAFSRLGVGIDSAKQIAFRLNDIVQKQRLFTTIQRKNHLWVEAWCTCAAMCGLSPRTVWCRRITDDKGLILGYEARVEVVRLATNEVVGAAETECWMDERSGGKIRWTEKHAAKSMAQTRATSKAIAQILRWIPVLAGYSGTPAEETGDDNGMPQATPNPEPIADAPKAPGRADRINVDDIAKLSARWKSTKQPEERTKDNWSKFVARETGRIFDVGKWPEWTPADVEKVAVALSELGV